MYTTNIYIFTSTFLSAFDLLGHVDGNKRDLVKLRLSQLFKPSLRSSVTSRSDAQQTARGIMGGDDHLRKTLDDATKSDELMRKVLDRPSKTRFRKAGVKPSGPPAKSGKERARSKSRSPARKVRPERPTSSKGNTNPYSLLFPDLVIPGNVHDRSEHRSRAKKPQSNKPFKSGGNAKKATSEKSKFFSPNSFEDAQNRSFFSATAIMLITAAGFIFDRLPTLHSLNLGGRLQYCLDAWDIVTNSHWVKQVVKVGYKIPFKFIPTQLKKPTNPKTVGPAYDVLISEAADLTDKGAIKEVVPAAGEYVSSYFAVPKPRSPGKFRPILNLKRFNKSIKKYKFRMECLSQVRDWLLPGSFMVGIDLKDQFLHVPVHNGFRKFLRFSWLDRLFEWQVLPFGLRCSPRVVTKILKPVMAFLRATFLILISIYMDDMLIQARSSSQAYLHAQITILILMCLGWSINWQKSTLVPSQQIVHLGFLVDTEAMTVSCPEDKINRLTTLARYVLSEGYVSVHNLERLLGQMESVRPVTPMAAVWYRSLQRQLLNAKKSGRRPAQLIYFNKKSLGNLSWWVSPSGFRGNCTAPIRPKEPNLDIWCDASTVMLGAHNSKGECVQRPWSDSELASDPHINVLEMKAAREAVLNLAQSGDTVRLHIDNKTAICYIKRQGGTRSNILSQEACAMWLESEARQVTILEPHWISSADNTGADFLSRNVLSSWEFRLDQDLFTLIQDHFEVYPTLDVFASRWSARLPRYMTWEHDQGAVARDALMAKWDRVSYLFPPVPLMLRVLQMLRSQKIEALLVCPKWPTSLWWPLVEMMMVAPPLPLPALTLAVETPTGVMPSMYMNPLVALHVSGKIFS